MNNTIDTRTFTTPSCSSTIHFDNSGLTMRSYSAPALSKYVIDFSDFSEETYQRIIQKILSEFSKKPVVEHKCRNCGAVLEMDANKPIFICKYCGTTYAVGTNMINDRGD